MALEVSFRVGKIGFVLFEPTRGCRQTGVALTGLRREWKKSRGHAIGFRLPSRGSPSGTDTLAAERAECHLATSNVAPYIHAPIDQSIGGRFRG
jgi:hypothetical protein